MSTKLAYKNIPLYIIEPEQLFALLQIKAVPAYDENHKPTSNIVGYSYTVANTDSFEKYNIKVLGGKPLMSPEELRERREKGERFIVEFDNATVKMYWDREAKTYADSYSADGISFVSQSSYDIVVWYNLGEKNGCDFCQPSKIQRRVMPMNAMEVMTLVLVIFALLCIAFHKAAYV